MSDVGLITLADSAPVHEASGVLWNPLLHPKDAHGKWIKTAEGTYLYANTKHATFTSQGITDNIPLNPGDTATEVTKINGAKWLVVRHPDGKYTVHWRGSAGALTSSEIDPTTNLAKAADPSQVTPPHLSAKVVKVSPSIAIKAATQAEAAAKLNDPTGKSVVDVGNGHQVVLEPTQLAFQIAPDSIAISTSGYADQVYENGVLVPDPDIDYDGVQDAITDGAPEVKGTLYGGGAPQVVDVGGGHTVALKPGQLAYQLMSGRVVIATDGVVTTVYSLKGLPTDSILLGKGGTVTKGWKILPDGALGAATVPGTPLAPEPSITQANGVAALQAAADAPPYTAVTVAGKQFTKYGTTPESGKWESDGGASATPADVSAIGQQLQVEKVVAQSAPKNAATQTAPTLVTVALPGGLGSTVGLHPGQKAYLLPGGTMSIIVTDGSVTQLFNGLGVNITGTVPAVVKSWDNYFKNPKNADKFKLLAENPPTPPPVVPEAPETFTHPVSGAVVLDPVEIHQHNQAKTVYMVKTKSGSWLFLNKHGKVSPAGTSTPILSSYTQAPISPPAPVVPIPEPVVAAKSMVLDASALPIGTVVQHPSGEPWSNGGIWTKIADNSWSSWSGSGAIGDDNAITCALKSGHVVISASQAPVVEPELVKVAVGGVHLISLAPDQKAYKTSVGTVVITTDGVPTAVYDGGKIMSNPSVAGYTKLLAGKIPGSSAELLADGSQPSLTPVVAAPAPIIPTKPVKTPVLSTPTEYTLPTGSILKLVPGMTVYKSGSSVTVFNPDGTGTKYFPTGGTSTYVGKKSHYKDWVVVADIPLPKFKAPDLSAVEPDDLPLTHAGLDAYVDSRKAKINALTHSVFNYSYKQTLPKTESPFHNYKPYQDAVAALAAPEFQSLVDSASVSLGAALKKADIDKGEKISLGKDRSRFEFLGQISRFAQLLQNPDSDLDAVDSTWAQIASKLGDKHNTTFGPDFHIPNNLRDKLATAVSSWHFKQTTKDLGFDPDTASLETLQGYMAAQGFPAVGGLTHENAQLWVKAQIGDPSVLADDKDSLQAQILSDATIKLASAAATIFLKNKNSTVDPVKQSAHDKAVVAQQQALINQAKLMSSAYKNSAGGQLYQVLPDIWEYFTPDTGTKHLTQLEAFDLIKAGGWKPEGKTDYQSKWDSLLLDLGLPEGAALPTDLGSVKLLNSAIKARGGSYTGKLNVQDKDRWLRAWAVGDNTLMYSLEQAAALKSKVGAGEAHKNQDTNPGSPQSPAGKAYLQTLSDFLHSSDWYSGAVNKMSNSDVDKAWDALQLDRHAFVMGFKAATLLPTTRHQVLLDFLATRGPLPEASYTPEDLQLKPGDTEAPEGVSQGAWDFLLAVEHGAPEVTTVVDKFVGSQVNPSTLGTSPQTWEFVPDNIKKLATWSQSNPTGNDSNQTKQFKQDVRTAIVTRANSGAYIPTDVPQVKLNGKSYPLAPGSKVYREVGGSYHYIINPDGKTGQSLAPSGSVSALNTSGIAQILTEAPHSYKLIVSIPNTLTYAQAKADGLKADQFTWDALAETEVKAPGDIKLPNISMNVPTLLFEVKNGTSLVDGSSAPAELKANADKLPLSTLMVAAWATQNDPATLEAILYKLKSGYYSQLQTKPLVDPSSPFGKQVLQGNTTPDAISAKWSTPTMLAFDKVYGTKPPIGALSGSAAHAQVIANKIDELFNPQIQVIDTAPAAGYTLPPLDQLKLTKISKKLSGMHSKDVWVDQLGNEWMTKAFPSDPNSKARIDAEHNANVIGRMFGFRNPETTVQTLNGIYSYVQHLKPATGDLNTKTPAQLNDEQLAQAMEEHVLDWLVSNHDSHPGNLLLDPDGKSVIGIDLGQAGLFTGDDKLEVGYKATNPIHVWYDQFYKAVQSGQIDQKRADYITRRVLTKALRVQNKYTDEFRSLILDGVKNRTKFPPQLPTKDQFVDYLVQRKSGIATDFDTLYKSLYNKAGWDYPFDLENLQNGGGKLGNAYLGISPEFMADVKANAAHGKSVFFATPDIDGQHALIWTENNKGSTDLRGEMTIRKAADKVITAWLAKQAVSNEVSHSNSSVNQPSAPDHEFLPNNQTWYSSIVAGAKTVNTHQADGAYNTGTLASMDSALDQMQQALSKLDQHVAVKPNLPFTYSGTTFVTKEQQDAWRTMLTEYIKAAQGVQAAKAASIKTDKPAVTLAQYTASKGLDTKHFIPGTTPTAKKAQDGDIEAQSVVEVEPGKLIKVTKRKAYGSLGTFDPVSGQLKTTGTLESGHTGYQFDIEYGPTKISYRPHTSEDVKTSQQGQLRWTVSGWDGQDTAPLQDVLDTLQDIGLNLDPATESSLEAHYWEHLYAILQDRNLTGKNQVKLQALITEVKSALAAKKDMADEDKASLIKGAFAKVWGQDVVDQANWYPQFGRNRVHGAQDTVTSTSGHPYWVRPDYSLQQLYGLYNGSVPSSSGGSQLVMKLSQSGSALSTEERLRQLGQFITGMSSTADQKTGGANFVFMRQNTSHGTYFYHPSVALRSTNYAFNGDKFGEITIRKDKSPWELDASTKFGNGSPSGFPTMGGTPELMVKHSVSIRDDIAAIVFNSASERQQAISFYQSHGVTTINGLPLEQVFVTNTTDAQKAVKVIWTNALAQEKQLKEAKLSPSQMFVFQTQTAQGTSFAEALKEAKAS